MIIENLGEKYYVPDEIGNDKTKSVAEVFAASILYSEYIKQENLSENKKKLAEIESLIIDTEKLDDTLIIENDYKFQELTRLKQEKEIILNQM